MAQNTAAALPSFDSSVWNDDSNEATRLVSLPIGNDGELSSARVKGTRTEARFFSALVAFASPELIEKAVEYAKSNRA